jgi:formylglycine-generating enzyme required for sulfatase activity
MKFEPLGSDLMVSVWETRVKDYAIFCNKAKYQHPRQPGFAQTPDHPVIYVSRDDANAFCEWLTERDRLEERIAQSHRYRLPTDIEWSRMVGLDFEFGDRPGQRDANKQTIYSWGTEWPPPNAHANYADESAASLLGISADRTISDYSDGFPRTSPSGSYPPNSLGLQDLSGNAHEWVSDDMSTIGQNSLGILRGGGWNTYLKENLLIGWRNPVPSTYQGSANGFRIVLSRAEPSTDEEITSED